MEGWHFMKEDCCLNYGDGRKAVVGETLTVECEPILCKQGLHASKRIIDALSYANGTVCSLVEVGGVIVEGDDKFAGQSRKVLWMQDISEILHIFACDVAEKALNDGNVQDKRSHEAIRIKRLWITGDATDEELASARDAARDAALGAAWDAWYAARGAALDAARDAWYAARGAARDAALGAARDAWYAAWGARDAARDAAWGAARDEQNAELERRVRLLMLQP